MQALDPGKQRLDRVRSENTDLTLEPSQMDEAYLNRDGPEPKRLSCRNTMLSRSEVAKLAVVSD